MNSIKEKYFINDISKYFEFNEESFNLKLVKEINYDIRILFNLLYWWKSWTKSWNNWSTMSKRVSFYLKPFF